MSALGAALFETPIGWCGVVWGPAGLRAVQLPERDRAATAARLRTRLPGATVTAPPADVADACRRMALVLDGVPDDLADVAVDLTGVGAFEVAVYALTRAVPPGRTTTYGELAAAAGAPGAARAVGRAMGRNPCPLVVPCHRVLAAQGATGGFSAHGGVVTKRRLLFLEGALASEPQSLFDA